MEWWQILILTAVVAVAGVAGEVYLRLAPQRELRREERQKAQKAIKDELEQKIIPKAKTYRSVELTQLQELTDNRYIPRELRMKLADVIRLAREYGEWRVESWRIVNSEANRLAQTSAFKELNDSLTALIGGNLYDILSGYEGHFSEPVYQAIYEGNLTFELARDAVLEHRWDLSKKVDDKTIKLKDAVESEQFHKCIEQLKAVQDWRQSLRMLRNVRERLLERAQSVLKEVT